MGRVSGMTTTPSGSTTASTIASNVTYEPFGPVTGLSFGNGAALTVHYDQDYRPTARVVAGTATIQNLAYGYYPTDDLQTISDNLIPARSQSFQYDALYHLTNATGFYGTYSYGITVTVRLLTLMKRSGVGVMSFGDHGRRCRQRGHHARLRQRRQHGAAHPLHHQQSATAGAVL